MINNLENKLKLTSKLNFVLFPILLGILSFFNSSLLTDPFLSSGQQGTIALVVSGVSTLLLYCLVMILIAEIEKMFDILLPFYYLIYSFALIYNFFRNLITKSSNKVIHGGSHRELFGKSISYFFSIVSYLIFLTLLIVLLYAYSKYYNELIHKL